MIVIVIVVAPMVPIVASMVVPIGVIFAITETFVISVVPSMFRAIVGVYMAVIYVISSKYAPWILRDLVSDRRMFSQEVSYFFVLIEILAVVN